MKKLILLTVAFLLCSFNVYCNDDLGNNWSKLKDKLVLELMEFDLYSLTQGIPPDHVIEQLKAQGITEEQINEAKDVSIYRANETDDYKNNYRKQLKEYGLSSEEIEKALEQPLTNPSLFEPFDSVGDTKALRKLTTENWFQKSLYFKEAFLERAKQEGLDYRSLEKSFDKILYKADSRVALIPIKVIYNQTSKEAVWVIYCIWELAEMMVGDEKDKYPTLSHHREWIIEADTQKLTGFSTCM